MVLSALRHKPHPSHATVEQALGWARRIGARQTWLTHIAHELGHEETNRALPAGVALAYDGLTVPVTPMSMIAATAMIPVYRSVKEIPTALAPRWPRSATSTACIWGTGDAERRGGEARALGCARLQSPLILTQSSFCVRRKRPG